VRLSTFGQNKSGRSGHPGESVLDSDDESARAILDDDEGKNNMGIMKTTKVVVTEEEGRDARRKRSSASLKEQERDNWNGRQETISHAV
jgi:hypothetical protein